MLNQKITTENI